jgi:hypothetical protein
MPACHSSMVNSTSLANSWTCLNREAKTRRERSEALGPMAAMTLGVKLGSKRSVMMDR